MTALNIWHTASPTPRGPVQPMSAEDARFWKLPRERRERESKRGQA